MSQLSLSLDSSLLVRDDQGRYLPATADQILEAARYVIDQKMPRGTLRSDPKKSGAWISDISASMGDGSCRPTGAESNEKTPP